MGTLTRRLHKLEAAASSGDRRTRIAICGDWYAVLWRHDDGRQYVMGPLYGGEAEDFDGPEPPAVAAFRATLASLE